MLPARTYWALTMAMVITANVGAAWGQTPPPKTSPQQQIAETMKIITDTADRICGIVTPNGESQSLKINGDVKAQLNGLVKKLADIGISGTADFLTDSYVGVIRADLPTTLAGQRDCKERVFNKLSDKLIQISDDLPKAKDFEAIGPEVAFGCEEGAKSTVSYNAPSGYKILNASIQTFGEGFKYSVPKITDQSATEVKGEIYFMGRDRNIVRDCPGGGNGHIRLYGTIQKE